MEREYRGPIPAIGICECCGAQGQLHRTYFHYNFQCQCHSPFHFVVIDHCEACSPTEPIEQKISFSKEQIQGMEKKYEVSTD